MKKCIEIFTASMLILLGFILTKPQGVYWKISNRFAFFESEMLKMESEFERFRSLDLKKNEIADTSHLQNLWDLFLSNKESRTDELVRYPAIAVNSTPLSYPFLIHGDDAIEFLIGKINDSKKENIFVLQTLFLLGFPVLDSYESILAGDKKTAFDLWQKVKDKTKKFRLAWTFYQQDVDGYAKTNPSFWYTHDVHRLWEIFNFNTHQTDGADRADRGESELSLESSLTKREILLKDIKGKIKI